MRSPNHWVITSNCRASPQCESNQTIITKHLPWTRPRARCPGDTKLGSCSLRAEGLVESLGLEGGWQVPWEGTPPMLKGEGLTLVFASGSLIGESGELLQQSGSKLGLKGWKIKLWEVYGKVIWVWSGRATMGSWGAQKWSNRTKRESQWQWDTVRLDSRAGSLSCILAKCSV